MIISVINQTHGDVADKDILFAIRAINRQINEDFLPYWSFGGSLRLEGSTEEKPNKERPIDMRGDAVVYMWDKVDIDAALGYHNQNFSGIPYGMVYTRLSKQLNEHWSVTLSHEVLEIIGDPETNLLVMGPHPDRSQGRNEPDQSDRIVFHAFEMCDAVQAESYEIDGVGVSNFVLPLYFTSGDEFNGRNDFLGTIYKRRNKNRTLESFSVNPGGYVGFYDPLKGKPDIYMPDKLSRERRSIKMQAEETRRLMRYKQILTRTENQT